MLIAASGKLTSENPGSATKTFLNLITAAVEGARPEKVVSSPPWLVFKMSIVTLLVSASFLIWDKVSYQEVERPLDFVILATKELNSLTLAVRSPNSCWETVARNEASRLSSVFA